VAIVQSGESDRFSRFFVSPIRRWFW